MRRGQPKAWAMGMRMSGVPIWAIMEPSLKQMAECTIDCVLCPASSARYSVVQYLQIFPILPNLLPAGVWVVPAVGEQWQVRRVGDSWFLDARVAFQDPRMNLREKEGTTGIGSSGPTYIVGSGVYVGPDHLDLLEKIAELEHRIEDLESGG